MSPPDSPRRAADPAFGPGGANPEATVDLGDDSASGGGAARTLPHERDQQSGEQAPAAGQDQTPEAREAFLDAERGLPDTSAAPLLQQPSPRD